MRILHFMVGALAGLCDLASRLVWRDVLLGSVVRNADTLNGFDLTADLYLLHPKWILRRR